VILEVAVIPRPDLDDFRRDSPRSTIAVGFGASYCDSAFPADLASVPDVLVDLVHDSAVPACFATFALRRRFLGPCRFFLGRTVNVPPAETADGPLNLHRFSAMYSAGS
jgi:hypothetical protein